MIAWSDERLAELRKAAMDGLSASKVAAEMGTSRNAILGAAFRNHITFGGGSRDAYRRSKDRRQKPTVARQAQVQKPAVTQPPAPPANPAPISESPVAPAPPPLVLDPAEIPTSQRKQLLELGNGDCRFPYGDPGTADFFFCGAPEADFAGRVPYCPRHRAFAYRRGGE